MRTGKKIPVAALIDSLTVLLLGMHHVFKFIAEMYIPQKCTYDELTQVMFCSKKNDKRFDLITVPQWRMRTI